MAYKLTNSWFSFISLIESLLPHVNHSSMDLFIIKTRVKLRETIIKFSEWALNDIRKNFSSITYSFPIEQWRINGNGFLTNIK